MSFAVAFTDSRGCAPLTAAAAAEPSAGGAWLSWAELSRAGVSQSARSDNVKLESDRAGLLCGRTAASFSGIKIKSTRCRRSHEARTGALLLGCFFLIFFFTGKSFSSLNNIPPCHMLTYISSWLTLWRNWLAPSLKGSGAGEHRFPRFFFTPPSMFVLLLFLMTHLGRSKVLREDPASLYGIIVDEGALFLR